MCGACNMLVLGIIVKKIQHAVTVTIAKRGSYTVMARVIIMKILCGALSMLVRIIIKNYNVGATKVRWGSYTVRVWLIIITKSCVLHVLWYYL